MMKEENDELSKSVEDNHGGESEQDLVKLSVIKKKKKRIKKSIGLNSELPQSSEFNRYNNLYQHRSINDQSIITPILEKLERKEQVRLPSLEHKNKSVAPDKKN